MTSVALAVIAPDGTLLDANDGFRIAACLAPDERGYNVADVFLAPQFSALTRNLHEGVGTNEPPAILFEGLLTMGEPSSVCGTLKGTIRHVPEGLFLTAEYPVSDLQALTQTLLELNEQFVEQERTLVRVNRELQQHKQQLEDQSLTDALTGLANRRHFERRLKANIAAAERHGWPLGIILADLDHFKQLNDTYGHLVGDDVLRAVGNLIRQELRPNDLGGRFGGEEFVILLPMTTLEDAAAVAERLRQKIATFDVPAVKDGITCSFGVATYKHRSDDADALVRRADEALYDSKTAGRNTITVAREAP